MPDADLRHVDLLISGGRVVTASGVAEADVAISKGLIVAVGPGLTPHATEVIDARGLHVFPGGIDTHVHLNEPGRTEWETIANGSAALAAGGYTAFVDMPLNSIPVTTTVEAFDLKLEAMQRSSRVDFGLWGGLIPDNIDRLEGLQRRGALGFKAFMCSSGIDEFPACDERILREGMKRIAELGSILLVHAEDPVTIALQASNVKGTDARAFADSRPSSAEAEAVYRAMTLAHETGCRLHVVHVSTPTAARMIEGERRSGYADVSAETCPHYLIYSRDDLVRLGGVAKSAPPFRLPEERDALRKMVYEGDLEMVVSDHSPSTIELKQGPDFFKLWGGLSGCQSTRQLLLGWFDPALVAAVTSTNVARRFQLAGKGDVDEGFDADLWLVDLDYLGMVHRDDLLYRNPFSVHEGQTIRGRTVRTLVRGRTVFADGHVIGEPAGRFIHAGARS
ncbi:MAG: allantoinase AllB [Candidatus Dormibacterales bacterium]